MTVVEVLDELEDRSSRLGLALEPIAIEKLAFEGGVEAFTHGIIIRIPNRAPWRDARPPHDSGSRIRLRCIGWTQMVVATPDAGGCDEHSKAAFGSVWSGALFSPGRPAVAGRDEQRRFWAAIAVGMASEDAAVQAGMSQAVGTRLFRKAGGMPPAMFRPSAKALSGWYLSFAEREEIALLRVQGCSIREVARQLGMNARRPVGARGRPRARHEFLPSAPHRIVPAATAGVSPMRSSRWRRHPAAGTSWRSDTGLMIAHEAEPLGGIAFVSRANQAAFDSISRSRRSWGFSRRG